MSGRHVTEDKGENMGNNHDETVAPDKTPDPQGKNTTVPDSPTSSPIPFGHEDDDEQKKDSTQR